MSDTPLTDAESARLYGGKFNMLQVTEALEKHAGQLEKQLTAAQTENARLTKERDELSRMLKNEAERAINAEEENARLRALLAEAQKDWARLDWHKGPALDGEGTEGKGENGGALWCDGDHLLIAVDTNNGQEIACIHIQCDEHFFTVIDASSGDVYDAWEPDAWSWWAKLTEGNLPPQLPAADATTEGGK